MTTILPLQTSERPRGGLESVARPLVGPDGQVLPESEWRGGVELVTGDAEQGFVWPVSCTATPELRGAEGPADGKDGGFGHGDQLPFEPLVVGALSSCLPGRTVFGDLQRIMATNTLERVRYQKLAEALFTGGMGATDESNPSLLAQSGVTPPGHDATTPNTIRLTVAGLLNGICQYGGSDWVFHAPIQALPMIKAELGLVWNTERGVWTMGPFDWSFDCYPNLGPSDVEAATPTVQDGTAYWIWLTRRPMVAWADEITTVEVTTHQRNDRKVLVEQAAIVVVDVYHALAAKAASQ